MFRRFFRRWINPLLAEETKRCAHICEKMVIVGRARTHDQEVVAEALFAAAENIRRTSVRWTSSRTGSSRPNNES